MKELIYFALGSSLLLLTGCQFSKTNPLALSVPVNPSASSCPARFSFEDGTVDYWHMDQWDTPNPATSCSVSSQNVGCGNYSLFFNDNIAGGYSSQRAVLTQILNGAQDFSGKTVSAHICFSNSPPPPANMTITCVIRNQLESYTSVQDVMVAGGVCNTYSWTFGGSNKDIVMVLFLFGEGSSTTTAWNGTVWVDDINW